MCCLELWAVLSLLLSDFVTVPYLGVRCGADMKFGRHRTLLLTFVHWLGVLHSQSYIHSCFRLNSDPGRLNQKSTEQKSPGGKHSPRYKGKRGATSKKGYKGYITPHYNTTTTTTTTTKPDHTTPPTPPTRSRPSLKTNPQTKSPSFPNPPEPPILRRQHRIPALSSAIQINAQLGPGPAP